MNVNVILGIDFGTTNSCVSYYNINKNEFIVIPNPDGQLITPSIIYFSQDNNDQMSMEILYGSIANKLSGPCNFSNLKRLIGQNKKSLTPDLENLFKNNIFCSNNDTEDLNLYFQVNNLKLTIDEIITIYIKYLVNYACEFLNLQKNKDLLIDIVITIPAYYNDHQREIIKECCIKAGCNVIRIINEPTAAALAYIQTNQSLELESEYILVFDCGGGTTDLSLLHMDYTNQLYEVKNVVGNNFLGGEDITELLTTYYINKCKENFLHLPINSNKKLHIKIKKECENIKKELSFKQNVNFNIEFGDVIYTNTISQTIFLNICNPFFDKIKKLIKSLLDELSSKEISKINKVIFVGGTSRIPYFKNIFKQFLSDDILINSNIDPDQTISIGAAVQGALLKGMLNNTIGNLNDALLLDVIPLSIGIETLGGIMTPIISRNTIIPISRTKEFTNYNDTFYENEISIDIYQGERKFIADNFFLTNFNLSNLPKVEKEKLLIKVTFDVDSSGIITASASIINNDNDKKIQSELIVIKQQVSSCINNKMLEDILLDAENNKLHDSEMSNKIFNKIELYNSFKYLLSIFHEKRDLIINENYSYSSFLCLELNKLFNYTFHIIQNYKNYSPKELLDAKINFEKKFHVLLFDTGFIDFSFGSTSIEI